MQPVSSLNLIDTSQPWRPRAILSSTPRPTHRSFWLEQTAGDAPDVPPLAGGTRADAVVVGGGYTGLWSAIEIKLRQPSVDVVLLEADTCGSGASGRNGGFALTWWSKIALLPNWVGDEEAIRLATESVAGVEEIGAMFQDHGLDCEFHQDGWLWAAASPSQLGAWDSTLAECARLGVEPFKVLDRKEVARRSGSPVHLGGVFDPGTASVQPAKFVRGLRHIALGLGVRIFEHSPVQTIEPTGPLTIVTPGGTVHADKAILATNVWSAGMPEFSRTVMAISSDMIATAPIPEQLEEIGWTRNECISDSQLMIHYYRKTCDGRIAFGKGGWGIALGGNIGKSFDRSKRRAEDVARNFRRIYPMLADAKITHDWSGAIDRTVTGLPLIGYTDATRRVVHAVGWSANCVGPARTGAKIVASLTLDQDDVWSRSRLANLQPLRFPPEPFRYLGAHVVRNGVVAKERAELDGRRPGRLPRLLAAQVPSGLIPRD